MRLNKALAATVIFGILALLCVFMLNLSLSLKHNLQTVRSQQAEMLLLKDEYSSLKSRTDVVKGRKSLMNVGGIVQAVDEIFLPLGLKERVASVKPTGAEELRDAVVEEAEVEIGDVNMNEMVNIFYKIENAPMALSVRMASIEISFRDPTLLNITMTISLIRPK